MNSIREKHTSSSLESSQLKYFILTLRDYFFELIRKWYVYFILGALFAALAFWYHGTKTTSYVAKASFMSTKDEGGGSSGLRQLAGQFGFGSQSEVSSEKLVELLGTKRIVLSTLMIPVTIKEKEDLLINHFIEFYESYKQLDDKNSYSFQQKPIEEFSFEENLIANHLFGKIHNKMLNARASKNGIVRIYFESESEELAKYFTEHLVTTLKDFYIERSIEKQKANLEIINERADSIKRRMDSNDSALLEWYDAKQKRLKAGSLSAQSYITKVQKERDAEISSAAYVEALKSKEMAEINLEMQTPMIQVIDFPTFPLQKLEASFLLFLIFGIFVSIILSTLLIILNKLFRDALNS